MRRLLILLVTAPLVLAVLVAAALYVWNGRDVPLDPAVAALLARRHEQVAPADNLFYYLLAFDVRAADPAAAGRHMAANYRGAVAHVPPLDYAWADDPAFPRGRIEGSVEQLCGGASEDLTGCIERVRGAGGAVDALLADNRWLLDRYQAALAYRHLEYPLRLTPTSPVVQWAPFMSGKRLYLTLRAREFLAGRTTASLTALRDDGLATRRLLAEPDLILIDKLVLAASLRQSLEFAAEAMRERPLATADYALIRELAAPLTDAERSLSGVLGREFEALASMLEPLGDPASGPRFLELDGDRGPWSRLKGRLAQHFFKLHATLNDTWRKRAALIALAARPCTALATGRAAQPAPVAPALLDLAYNPIGRVLVAVVSPVAGDYPERQCDLEVLQRLVWLQAEAQARALRGADLGAFLAAAGPASANPYTGRPFLWDGEARAVRADFATVHYKHLSPWRF